MLQHYRNAGRVEADFSRLHGAGVDAVWLAAVVQGTAVVGPEDKVMLVALHGDQGKTRPALVIQADGFAGLPGVTVLPLTSTLLDVSRFRAQVYPDAGNGLTRRSQVMVDKPQTPPRARLGRVVGRLDDAAMQAVSRALVVFFGLA